MKNIIKTSLLVAIFMTFLTVVSLAADKNASVRYGELTANGSMTINVEFPEDRDMASSSYDGLFTSISADNWSVAADRQSMTITATGVDTKSFIRYYSGGSEDEGVTVKVATPFQMNVGGNLTYESSTITNSSDTSVVSFSGNTLTALKAGTSTITLSDTTNGGKNYTYEHQITVVGSDPVDPGDDSYDFSSATYKYSDNELIISNVAPVHNLYYIIDSNPTTEYSASAASGLSYFNAYNAYAISLVSEDGDKILRNEDTYIHIYQETDATGITKITDKKLEKPDLSSPNLFSGKSFASYTDCQLLLEGVPTWLCGSEAYGLPQRTLTYRIGKITDNTLLRAIQNNDASAFSSLLTYAKDCNNVVVEKTEKANELDGYRTETAILDGIDLVNGAYYYLYMVVDDENGKYIPIESVTITKASVYPDQDYKWFMFFYGSEDFNMDIADDDETPSSTSDDQSSSSSSEEPEKLPSKLAKTGEPIIFLVVIGALVISSIVIRKKIQKI